MSAPARQLMAKTSSLILAAALAIPAWSSTSSAWAESADCRRATRPVDQAICTTPTLRSLDRRIANRYAALLAVMDDEAAKALRQDQRWFISARDQATASLTGSDLIETLTDRLSARTDFLDDLRDNPSEGVVGRWTNLYGEVTVTQWATGVLTVEAQTVDALSGRWVCEVHGNGEWTGAEEATFEINTDDSSKWSLVATRQGDAISLEERHVGGDLTAPYCGMNGTISGTYFRGSGPIDPSR